MKLDATAPHVVSVDPSSNANSVAPNSPVTIVFSEPLAAATVNASNFRVIASDDSQAAPVAIATATLAGGLYRVTLSPATLLKSNMSYTISIAAEITDLSGNRMALKVTTSFTTVDYTEPRVVSTTPSIDQAIGDGTTFYLHFTKAIDGTVFAAGGSGTVTLQQLDHNHGLAVGSPLPISVFISPTSASTLVIAPSGVALQAASFYRITINGARDTLTPPNVQTVAQSFDFFSADHVRPVATIDAPAAATKLIAGVDYVATVAIVDEGITPPRTSTDISYVQWFDKDGKALARATTAPYGYILRLANGVTTATLKASAVDLSGNTSDITSQTWDVSPNLSPQNIVITVPASSYVARSVALTATFDEDGLAVTSALAVTAKHRDGTAYVLDATRIHRVSAQPLRRTTTSDAWTPVQYTIDIPADAKEADVLQLVLTLTDADNQSSQKTASIDILADVNPPRITAILPAGETHYKFGDAARNHYRAQVTVTDPESGVAHVTFAIDGHTTDVATASLSNGVYTFFTDVDVAAKNVDTRIHITATAYDYDGNLAAQTTDVIYESVNDGTAPMVWWLTPLDGSLVAKGNNTLILRIRATDDIHVDSVTFDSPLFASVTADRLPNDIFQKSVTFDTPADGSSFAINATVSDSGHQTIVPITIDQAVPAIDLATDAQINSGNVADYTGKTVRIHGAGKKLYISVPVTLQNLIVADGAIVGNPDGTKIDVIVRDHLYVDGDSSIDVTNKGYLGAWATHESGGLNASPNGITLGNTTSGGASSPATGSFYASGSYAGFGGNDAGAATNTAYGSITNPTDFGSGGSGSFVCGSSCTTGGNGGGAVVLTGGSAATDLSRFVIAGAIRADARGVGAGGAGSGGSINIHARALVAGWASRITANGGDDDLGAVNTSRGGGGGRVAAVVTDRWDVEPTQPLMQARGGRNGTSSEARTYVDGGAGTVFVQKPGEANGELLVSALDDRHAASIHVTRATPLSRAMGTLIFDSIAAGPRALLRFDDDYTTDAAKVSIDATAVVLRPANQPSVSISNAPAAGTSLIQGSTLPLTYSAQSNAGVGEVHATLAAITESSLPSFDYPLSIPATTTSLTIPLNAAPGPAALTLRATDRSGRTADTAPIGYTIVANTAPVIDQFDVTPASLQMYAGHPITVIAAASDDLEVKTLTLTSSVGTIAPVTPVVNPATHGLSATFTITIPATTAPNTVVALTLSATDGSAAITTRTKSVTILHDANPPAITITAPSAGVVIQEGNAIPISATIIDAEVGVKQASASIDGVSVALTQNANIWTGTLNAPDVDGTADVPKVVTVTASDFENNAASAASVSINVRPIIDALAPTVTWTCATPGAMYPAGAIASLKVLAVPVGADSITTVNLTITDVNGTRTVPMSSAGSGLYSYDYTLPPAASDATVTLRAVANTLGGRSSALPGSLTIIAPGSSVFPFAVNTTIAATDTAYEGKTVIVTGGKLTIAGKHTFNRLIVLNGATVAQVPTDATTINRLDIAATTLFIACGGTIDTTGSGFLVGRTWNNTTTGASSTAGGSHGGNGGIDINNGTSVAAAAYGSLFDPNEPGAGGSTQNSGLSGGGIVRVQAQSIVLDGKITAAANGTTTQNFPGGAGGSIRIDTSTISGAGELHADGGGSAFLGGGGGRIAIYYSGSTGFALNRAFITAFGGGGSSPSSRVGASGTVYLRQVDGTGAKVTDELIVDNGTTTSSNITPFVDLGSGTVTAVSGNTLTLSGAVPAWVNGSVIEILDALGTVIASYEISSSTATTVTVIVPSGQTLNAPIGSGYRGSTKIATVTVGTNSKLQTAALRGDDMTLSGEIDTTEIRARNLTLKHASVRQTATTATTTNALRIVATGALSVDSTSVIDATGRGFLVGRTWNNTTSGASATAGGSHGGSGGIDINNGASVAAAVYGSVFDPNEPGGGGSTQNAGLTGGGVVRIQAQSIVLDGKITAAANGTTTQNNPGGAGGSIRIDTSTISGAGEVHADGGGSAFLGGGGGRIAIYYSGSTGLALNRAFITAFGGGGSSPPTRFGNAGTVYVRQVDSSGVKVMDELIIDNGTGSSSNITPLVDLGSGTVTAVSGNTLTLSGAVPAWVNGSLIEILDAVGTVIGSYEIASSTSTTVTVIVPTGQTLNAPIGSAYRGSTKIATVTVGTNSKLQTAALRGDDMTLSGEIDTTEIRARNLTLRHASVRQTATTATTTNALRVIATGALSVDSTSVIDATGRGFLVGRTWNNTTSGASATAGGSHGGSGGIDINNGASVAAAVYGSLFDPNEPGAGGSTQNSGLTGGGVVRIQAQSIVLDGKITTSGNGTTQNNPGGAGGSIRIDTSTISGAGEVHADGGGSAFLGGGGGRIAIYYSSSTGFALNRALITTVGGSGTTPVTRFGAAGTIYLRQVDTAGLKVADELIVDNGTTSFNNTFTPLVDLGTGTVTAVSGSTLTLSGAVPNWVAGSSIEIMDALGNVIAKYEIASSTATTVTVIVPSGQTLNAPIGSAYRGSMGIATVTVGANAKLQGAAFRGDDMTLSGEIDTTEIRARNLTLKHALVRQTPTTATTINALRIFASGTLSVDSSSVIDAAGRGFLVGRTWNNTTSGASVTGGGSHGGTGGHDINDPASVAAAVYGSLFDPNEPGAGGSTQNSGLSGGGIVRVQAQSIVLDGKITASGNGTTQNNPSGAGGSIRIDTSTISGAGEVHADGGASAYMDGGGGRVAIYYSGSAGLALNRALITTVGGSGGSPITRLGTAGTIYLRQVDSAGLKVTDELIVDNGTNAFNSFTPLVDLGTGTVTAVSGSVLTLSGAVPNWVARSSIEILDALGSVIAKYEIASSTATTVTVIVPSGQTLNAPTGSGYRGSMGIATVTVGANAKLQAAAFRGDDMTLSGEIDTTEIAARNLTLKHALVRQTATTATITNALRIVATGVLSIDSSSVIDATGRGFLAGRTWNNSTMGASVAGAGSHGGLGGLDTGSPSGFVAVPYGSLYNPNEPGGGGATSGTSGQTGGGVVRIAAQSIMLDGKITALGIGSTTQNVASGAGGSVRIDATTISGIGEVHADGGPSLYLGGGGGRVAIYYTGNTGLGLNRTLITAAGGSGGSPSSRVGAAGTIYLKRDTQPNGELIVDNGTNVTPQSTVLTPVGGGLITSVTSSIGGASDTIGDANAAFPIPNLLSGNRVYINGDKSLLWPVSGNTATALTFNVAANALNATVGQTYNGLYRFDTLKLRNAKLSSADEIESLTAVDQDAASSTTITSTPATAPSLSSLTAQPQSVTGGGTITLAIRMAARSQSTFVGLASTSAALPVPGSIIIPANALTASFTVTTANPAAAANVTVTATAGTSSVSTTVTVIPSPATLTSITLASQSVQGGTSVNATIVLGAAAPAGGASVAVSASNGSLATVPSVVVVPEGAATVAFTIGTAQTAASTAVTITGIYGSTQSATLTITPCSAMSSVSAPASAPLTTVWLDDALPSGATTSGVGGLATTQSASGTQSIAIPAASGSRQFAFTGGAALAVASGDKLVAYLLINPCNPPRQVMLVFSDATTDYRASWGEDLIEPTIAHTRFGTMPAGGTWLRLEMLAATIGAAGKNLTGLAIKVYDGEAWIDRIGIQTCTLSTAPPPASFSAVESVWFDDQLPAGAVPNPSVWSFDTTQRASGANSHKEPLGTGYRQHYFTGATNTMLVKPGDVLFTYVLVDPCNPPRQIQLQWFEGTNWNKANWGDPIGASFGTALNYQIGPIPDGGNWVRLEVPAQLVGLENKTVTGADFGITDGQAWFDRVGKFSRVDVAIGGTATQSSTFDSTTTADKAVDGKTDGVSGNGSISITTQQAQAWWQVDLGTSKAIDSVEVWNRTDCCANRLTGFWLFVSDSSFASTDVTTTLNQAGVSSYRYDGLPGTNVLFAVNRTGRYVRIQLMGTEFLQLAEVQVWAPGTAQRVNAAGGRSTATTQSSTSSGWVADRAVNGTTLPNSSDASLTSTNSEANAWWQIDLGSSQFVSSIDLFNRNDSSPQRLERFYVLASDNPFASSVLTDTLAQAGVSVIYTGIPASGRPAPASYSIPINRTARYVRVQLTTTDVLTLAEVQIWPLLQQLAPLDVAPGPRAAAIRAFDFKTAYRSRGAR